MALKRVWISTSNYYNGNNGRRLLVLHSSEGAQSYQDLGNFFAHGTNQASSHVGIDDKVRGTIGEYVKRNNSAWTAQNANMVAVQAELCTPSGASQGWSRQTWLNHDTMLRNAADWLREESNATGIPLTVLTPSQAQGSGRGVCQHKDLGQWGGGHTDCGPNFPMDYVMELAKGTTQQPPPPPEELEDMFNVQFVGSTARLVIPVQYCKGKSKLCLASPVSAQVRLQFSAGKDVTRDLGGDASQNTDIPEPNNPANAQTVLVTLNSGNGSGITGSYSDRT